MHCCKHIATHVNIIYCHEINVAKLDHEKIVNNTKELKEQKHTNKTATKGQDLTKKTENTRT